MLSAWTGPDLTGKCPNFDALDAAGVTYDPNTLTGVNKLCYQKYIGDGLAVSDYAPGNINSWKQMLQGSVEPMSGPFTSPTDLEYTKQSIQNNPGSLNVPQPGTTPVQPGTGLFTQIFHTLVQGGTPVAQAAINYQMQQAALNKQPIHVPTPIVHAATGGAGGMSAQTKQILWLAAGAVGVTILLAVLLGRKK
jgi:hypothetical protein